MSIYLTEPSVAHLLQFWDRDRAAAKNMAALGHMQRLRLGRPSVFKRQQSPRPDDLDEDDADDLAAMDEV